MPAGARTTPVPLTAVIVQATTALDARAAVAAVITQNGGVGTLGFDLPIVNGVQASLTTTEIGQLVSPPVGSPFPVFPDAKVLPAMAAGKPSPSPTPSTGPRQLDNVFRQVTGAAAVPGQNIGQGVAVAVIDTGIANLPDFSGRLRAGVDFSSEKNAQLDSYGHGTFVAGLIAGNGASSNGTYVGEAPGATLVPVKVAGKSGATTISTLIRALRWIQDDTANDIRIINMSLGAIPQGPTALNPLNQAVETMWRDGFVVVTSAGNNGPERGTITTPGDDPLVITVGALDDKDTVDTADDSVPTFSSNGPTSSDGWWKPDLIAPGKSVVSVTSNRSVIWSTYKSARVGSTNFVGSGTSFSAAITSGAAAILLRENPAAGPDEVKGALLTTTNQGPGSPNDAWQQGHGVLNVALAVAEPVVTLHQDLTGVAPPGSTVLLASTMAASGWADPTNLLYPLPYDGPGAHSLDPTTHEPLFHTSAWNTSAWNTSAWNTSAWNTSAWNATDWDTSAWNGTEWNTSAWN
jgi:serine protease AprX